MRLTLLVLALFTSGCASDRMNMRKCQVLEYSGAKGVPYGLVQLDASLESSLRSQLPSAERRAPVCWYATGETIIAGQRGPGPNGYVFVKSANGWTLESTDTVILQFPPF